MSTRNPFSDLRTSLVHQNKPAAICARLAYCVLAAKDYKQAEQLLAVLDCSAGFMATPYADALNGPTFKARTAWHHTYDRLREHALSYLDTRKHLAYA